MTEETTGRERQSRGAAANDITKRGWAARDVIGSITGRRRAEEALRESEQRWRSLVESIPDIIMTVDADGTILFINRTVLGFTVEGATGSSVYDYVPPEHHDTIRKRLEAAFEMGEAHDFEIGGAGPFGRTSWYFNRIGPVVQNGRVVAATLIATDITEKKRAEEALRESEGRYRDLAENLNDAIYEFNTSGRMTYVSPGMEDLSGHSASEMIGRSVTDLVHPDDLPSVTEKVQKRPFGDREPSEYRLLIKSGGVRWVRSLGLPMFEGDRVVGFRAVLTDITERKRAEEALRESEKRHRHLVENINEAIYEVDADARVTYISPVVEEVSGYSPSEIVGRPATDFVHSDDLSRVAEGFRSAVSGHPRPNEYRLLCKTGEVLWVRSFGRPVVEGDRVVGIRGVLTDITERKQAEEALRESEEKYRDLVENVNEAIYEMDADGRITYITPIAEQAIGYAPSEIVGRPFADFFHPDDLSSAVQGFQRALSGHPTPNQYRLLSKTGEAIWVRSFGRPIFEGECIVGVRGVLTDVTESMRAEEALRESEESYRDLVENINDVVFALDATGRLTYISPVVTGISGYSPSEMIGRPFTDFVDPDDVPSAMERFQRSLSGDHESIELRFVSKSGEVHWLRSSGRPIFDGDRVVGLRGVQTDITERKRAEEALRESEERFRQVAATAGEWINEIDAEGRFTYSSPAVKEILGYDSEEVIGKHFYDFYPAEEREQLLAEAREIRAGKREYFRVIARNVHRDGHTVVVESSGLPILDAEGNVLGYRNVGRDITERKRAEEALRESEEKYRKLVEDSIDGIAITEGAVIRFVNQAFLNMFGCQSEEEMVGCPVTDFLPPGNQDAMLERNRAREQGRPVPNRYEFEALRMDGSTFDAEASVGSVNYQGRAATQAVVRDITERKRAEQALRESEEKWRSLVENAPDIIMTVSADTTILSINHTVPGMTVDGVIGTSLYDYLSPEHRDRQRTALEEVFETGKPQSYEIAGTGPAGATSWYFSRIGPIVQDGTVVAAVLVTTDITEQRQAEEALRESEARLRAFANAVPDVAFILDENGLYVEVLAVPETKDLLYANGAILRGQRLHEVLPKKSADQFLSVVRKTIETQEPQIVEYVLEVQAGRRWFEGRTAPLSLPGEKQAVVWVSHDITERKQAEAGREKAREALDRKVERAAKRGSRYGLSFRELTVLDLVSTGKSDRDIASVLRIRPRTVSKHVENIRAKMGASSRTEAGVRAIKEKLLG